jgi:hypothetical protein
MPSPLRALPLRHRSYELMCHSRWALSCFGSLVRRVLAGCAQSLLSRRCPGELPDVIFENFSLDAGSRTPVSRVLSPVSSRMSSAFPKQKWVGFPRLVPRITTSRRSVFRGSRYSLMFRPPSLVSPDRS